MIFWLAVVTFCFVVLFVDVSLRAIEHDRSSGPPEDPYRLERWRAGEPQDPDEEP